MSPMSSFSLLNRRHARRASLAVLRSGNAFNAFNATATATTAAGGGGGGGGGGAGVGSGGIGSGSGSGEDGARGRWRRVNSSVRVRASQGIKRRCDAVAGR
jgi:hypothetical protein